MQKMFFFYNERIQQNIDHRCIILVSKWFSISPRI